METLGRLNLEKIKKIARNFNFYTIFKRILNFSLAFINVYFNKYKLYIEYKYKISNSGFFIVSEIT